MRGSFVAALGLLLLVPSRALAGSPPGSCIDVLPEPPRLVPSASSSAGGQGPMVHPRASAIEAARKAGLLTPEQQRTLAEADKALATRYPALLREWADFAKATYVMPQRTRLLEAFGWLYRLPGEHLCAELEPPRFLDRAQRIQVRKLGEPVPGECSVRLVEGPQPQLSIQARNCPLSELVRAWSNALTYHWPRYREPGLELKATGDRQHEELDLTLQLAQEPRAALRTAAGMLRAIKGLEAAPVAK